MTKLVVMRDIRMGINNLMLHGLRSLLTMLGMVFGVASVIAMLAVGSGAGQEALQQIRALGSDVIIMQSVKPVAQDKQQQPNNFLSVYGLTYLDMERLKETLPDVTAVVPVKLRREQVMTGSQVVSVRLVGTTPLWFSLVRRPLIAGRLLTPLDDLRRSTVVVITEGLARRLFPLQEAIGSSVRVAGNSYQVVGIVQSAEQTGGEVQSLDQDHDLYLPLSTLRERYGDILRQRRAGSSIRERVELHQILVKMATEQVVEQSASSLQSLIQHFHKHDDVELQIPLALLRQAEKTQRRFNIVLGAIAGISLLVGGIGIMNIMLASVTERTREIGIRRAIGARRRQIVMQFLIETVVLSCCGGVLGIALGLFLPWIITRLTGLSTVVTSGSLILSLLISVTVGVVFGLYPAIRASRLDPIVALRHE
ncbi:MAG: macrolide export ATP-binding/permease MacB [Desulfuromonas sp.]|nr:MAG: macrolide export ATP-binding/permease MacB [Desulfuromonas sp.]